jgi:integrase
MSIHKTKVGTWRVRWRASGVMQSKTFKRKHLADKFEAELKSGAISKGKSSADTFGEYAEVWYRDHCLVRKSPSQWVEDRFRLDSYILPILKTVKMRDLRMRDIVTVQSTLARDGKRRPKTINLITSQIQKMADDAVSWGYLTTNPFKGFKPLPVSEQPFAFWSREEISTFLTVARLENFLIFELILVAVNTGLRRGELQGLRRDCIDFKRREIIVRRSFCVKTNQLLQRTKSITRMRRVPMNDSVLEVLESRRDLPFDHPIFEGISFQNIHRNFATLIDKAKVNHIRFHDLRHTFASHLVMAGVPIFIVKELLGHSDIKMTMRYSHLSPDVASGSTAVLSEISKAVPKALPAVIENPEASP